VATPRLFATLILQNIGEGVGWGGRLRISC
jgi:hypothetical protein